MRRKRFLVLLGMVLGSYVPAAAQSPAPQVLLAQARFEPIIMMMPAAVSAPLPATSSAPLPATSLPLPQGAEKSPAHFSPLFGAACQQDPGLENPLPVETVRTLFVTQSSLPIAPLWGGRLQLGAFESTLNMQNVQLGPSASGGPQDFRPLRGEGYRGMPRSVSLVGISLTVRFGRHVQTGPSTHVWRCLAWIVGRGHACRL